MTRLLFHSGKFLGSRCLSTTNGSYVHGLGLELMENDTKIFLSLVAL